MRAHCALKWRQPILDAQAKSRIGNVCLHKEGTAAVGSEHREPDGRRTASILSSINIHLDEKSPFRCCDLANSHCATERHARFTVRCPPGHI